MNMMTNLRGTPAPDRGLVAVRAEAQPKPAPSIETVAKAFEAFKDTHETALKGKVSQAEIDASLAPINTSIDEILAAIDEQAKLIATAKLGNGAVIGDVKADPEYTAAFKAHMRKGDKAEQTVQAAMTRGSDPDGGYTAPIEWDRTMGEKLKLISPIRENARVISISVAGFKKNYSDRNVGSGWVGETASRPATTTPQIGQLSFVPGELYANPQISQQLLDDSALDLEKWLADEVSTEFARQEGIAFLSGDGVNKPIGILTYVTGAANAALHPYGDIKVVNSGNANQLTGDGVIDLMMQLPSAFAANAKLYMNRLSMGAARKLKDGQGNYLWQPSYQLGQPQTLAGAPIIELPDMPGVAAGNIAALYGDMEATYLVVDRIGIVVIRDPFTNKPFVAFYTVKRVGGGVHNPEPMRALKISA